MPMLSARIGCGLTADCTELSIDPVSGRLIQTRPPSGQRHGRHKDKRKRSPDVYGEAQIKETLDTDRSRKGELIKYLLLRACWDQR